MRDEPTSLRPYLRYIHEAVFALNTACAIVFLALASSEKASIPFLRLEIRINHFLRIRQTDFIRGHFAFWIPALGLALSFWVVLRIFSRAELTNRLLRLFAGAAAFFLLPAVWICADPHRGWLLWPPYGPLELAVVIIVFLLIFCGKWSVSLSVGLVGTATHYLFWYWLFNGLHVPSWDAAGYSGPGGIIIALGAAIAWVLASREDARVGLRR
jgi:hypothetical protein